MNRGLVFIEVDSAILVELGHLNALSYLRVPHEVNIEFYYNCKTNHSWVKIEL